VPQKIEGSQWDFSAGEVDVTFKSADDHPARKAGLRQCSNFRLLNSRTAQNRSGRRALFPEIGRNEKITVQPGVSYFIAFGNGTLHIRDTTGVQVASQAGYSWTTATVKSIAYCLVPRGSSGVDVVITFAGQIPKIARYTNGGVWTFLDFAFATNGTALQEPFYRINVPGVTLVGSNTVGAITLTASAPYFTAGMVGSRILYLQSQVIITGFTSNVLVNATVQQSLPGSDQANLSHLNGSFAPGDIIINQLGVKAEVVSIAATIVFNYIVAGTRFANLDVVAGPNGSFTPSAIASVIPQPTVIWAEEVMSALNGWPAFCFFDQGRLGFCNFPSVPRGIAWSFIGIPNNLFVGATPAAAMFEVTASLSQVLYVIPGMEGNEFVFCDNKVFYIPISVTNPLKPGSVAFNLLSDDGCASVQPRPVDGVIIYVNAGGNSMKAIVATGAFQRPFNTSPLNEFCSHLITNVVAIAVPRADTTFQERYVYVLNADGTLAVGKYNTELGQIKGVVGWTPFSGAGALQWISALQADVFFTTAYTPNGIGAVTVVEVLDDTQYLDCAIPVQNVPAPLVTAIGIPTNNSIGSVVSPSGNTASITITTTANIVTGDLVVVAFAVASNPLRTVSSVSDGTNTYTRAFAINDAGPFYNLEVWYKENAAAVSPGASLTATLSGLTAGSNGYGAAAFRVTGILASGSLDKTATQAAVTSAPTATTAALVQPVEIAIGASYTADSTRTYTEASGFTNLFNFVGGATSRIGIGFKIVSSAAAVTYNPTLSGSGTNQLGVATFKAAISGPLFAFANGSVTLMDQVTRNMGTYFVDANGNIIPQFNGGEDLTLASLVAGQPWTATLEPFAPDAPPGTDVGQRTKKRQIALFAAKVINSSGFLMAGLFSSKQNQTTPALGTVMNQRRVPAYEPGENQALAPVLRETVESHPPPGSSFDPRAAIIKDTPGPIGISRIDMEISI